MASNALPKHARDNRALQLNPLHPAYYLSRGASPGEAARAVAEQASGAEIQHRDDGATAARIEPPRSRVTMRSVASIESDTAHRGVSERLK